MKELISVISGVAIVQLLLFLVFLWFGKYKNKQQLAAFLGANILFLITFFISWEQVLIPAAWQLPLEALYCSGYFFAPALYLYIAAVVGLSVTRWQRLYISSFVLSLIYLSVSVIETLTGNSVNLGGLKLSFLMVLLMHLQILVFMFVLLRLIMQISKRLETEYSNLEKHKIHWIYWVVFAFIGMWMIDLFELVFGKVLGLTASYRYTLILISVGINALFANVTIFKGLSQPSLFADNIIKSPLTPVHPIPQVAQTEELKSRLLSIMHLQKPYLEPEITLSELAMKTGINTKYLSQILNDQLGKNFYEFINDYRVEEAKKMLSDSALVDKTILEILYSCGFNSKSVFNNVFKKNTGVTPSQFRNRKIAKTA